MQQGIIVRLAPDAAGDGRRTDAETLGNATETRLQPKLARYGAGRGPISGVRTGFATPKKTTVPLPPKRVDSAGGGTFLKPTCSGLSQLFATHTFPAGSMARSVRICNPPM